MNLARHHPVWLMDGGSVPDPAAAVMVDGDIDTCSILDQTFWAVDLGFNVIVDEVTIFSPDFAGTINFVFLIDFA